MDMPRTIVAALAGVVALANTAGPAPAQSTDAGPLQLETKIPLGDVRDDIEKVLLQQQRSKMQEDWVKDLRAKAYIRLF